MSVTDRCNLRCSYCTYWREWRRLPSRAILSYEELLHLASAACETGIRKVRVTGGEPLVRRGIVDFIRNLNRLAALETISLTTNGVFLREMAPQLFDAGLRHLNVSLDTLQPDRYRRITGGDHFREVWAGLERALHLGFQPLKINCVVLKGINDDELPDLALLAREYPFQVRFIELMPTGSHTWWQRHFLPLAEVRRRLQSLGPLVPMESDATAGPARIFRVPGFSGELGFISPMSAHHCDTCNRLRITAAGGLRSCLFQDSAIDLKSALRRGASDGHLIHLFHAAIQEKPGQAAGLPGLAPACLGMAGIGG